MTRSYCHNITRAKFRTYKISVQELPYSVSDHLIDCLSMTTNLIVELCPDLKTLHESNKFMKVGASCFGSDISQRRFPKDDVTGYHG